MRNFIAIARAIAPWLRLAARNEDKAREAYDRGDYTTALRQWRPLAESGHAEAQNQLGVMYEYGRGVVQDHAAAMRWYSKAAERGDAEAQNNLGSMYEKGHVVPQDADESMEWQRRNAGLRDDLPTVLIQGVEARTADDVVEIIYLENDSDRTYSATVRADFFTTVDDASGAAAHHGPAPSEVELAPGERARIGDILGWEWDSWLGLVIEFRHRNSGGGTRVSYDLMFRGRYRHVAGLGMVCEVPGTLLKR